jgi:hypothetical protein
MKTNKIITGFLFTVCLFYVLPFSSAQESASKNSMIYPSFGLGIGFFYPSDVNAYIEDNIMSGYVSNNYEIYEYLEAKAGLALRMPKFDFGVSLEYDIAPKISIVTNGESFSYAYNRMGPEIYANYYLSNKSGKNAFFIGAAVNYSFLWFKEFKGSTPGVKLQAGYSLQLKKINLQPYGAFRYAKATDETKHLPEASQWDKFKLTWIGFQVGVIISVHPRMLYK